MSEAAPKRLTERLRAMFRPRNGDTDLRDAIEELIEETADQETVLDPGERDLLRNTMKLREISAHDVMVPRADIVAIAHDVTLPDLVAKMAKDAHSRLPVYRESLDDIIGFVHIKDVLPFWGVEKPFKLDDILRRVLFVAPSMRALDLLLQMRAAHVHMALVVDEYGGIDGLVTIEDVIEKIVGEIEDEHDVDEGPKLVREAEDIFVADARLPLEDFEEAFGNVLTPEERDAGLNTLGGFVVSLAGRVPGRGEIIAHSSGVEFEILDADARRLKRLRVRRTAPKPIEGEEATG